MSISTPTTLPALASGEYRWHERFSQAWLEAVAAPCQINAVPLPVDNGIDYMLHFAASGIADYVPIQLKTISDDEADLDGEMSYPLDRSDYDALVRDRRRDGVLVVVALSPDPSKWVDASEHPLRLARRSWWVNVRAARPDESVTSEQKSVSVRLPVAQRLCPMQLQAMVARIAAGGRP